MQNRQKIRNPILALLHYITCGIYGLVMIYQISDEIGESTNDQSINPALEVVLSLITCFWLYPIYWCYKHSKKIHEMQINAGVSMPNDVSLAAMLLAIFQLTPIALLLMQSELNKVWEKLS